MKTKISYASFGGSDPAEEMIVLTDGTQFNGCGAAEAYARIKQLLGARTSSPVLLSTPTREVTVIRGCHARGTKALRAAMKKAATKKARRAWAVALRRDGEDFIPTLSAAQRATEWDVL